MKIGSVLENQSLEKRIAITPELIKKYINLGFEVNLIENYGSHLGIKDNQFKDVGVKISKDESEILNSSDIIVQLGMLSDEKISNINLFFHMHLIQIGPCGHRHTLYRRGQIRSKGISSGQALR